jgi:NADH dehydrogenase
VAPVAKQQGKYVARLLIALAKGKSSRPFRYRDFGSLATIGRKRAVAQIGRLKLSGYPAWLAWSLAHIYFLIGFRNRVAVALNWAWNYLTFQRGTRLITGITGSRIKDVAPPVAIRESMDGHNRSAPGALARISNAGHQEARELA